MRVEFFLAGMKIL